MLNKCTSRASAKKFLDTQITQCELRSDRDSMLSSFSFMLKSKLIGGQNAKKPEESYDTFQQVVAKKFEKRISINLNFSSANEKGVEGPNYIIDELKANIFTQINQL